MFINIYSNLKVGNTDTCQNTYVNVRCADATTNKQSEDGCRVTLFSCLCRNVSCSFVYQNRLNHDVQHTKSFKVIGLSVVITCLCVFTAIFLCMCRFSAWVCVSTKTFVLNDSSWFDANLTAYRCCWYVHFYLLPVGILYNMYIGLFAFSHI